jgi:hypothetical protein
MVAISLYGSGEGLGQGNRPAYSTTRFCHSPRGAASGSWQLGLLGAAARAAAGSAAREGAGNRGYC